MAAQSPQCRWAVGGWCGGDGGLDPGGAFVDSGYLLGALLAAMALLPATANTTIITRQLLLTPAT